MLRSKYDIIRSDTYWFLARHKPVTFLIYLFKDGLFPTTNGVFSYRIWVVSSSGWGSVLVLSMPRLLAERFKPRPPPTHSLDSGHFDLLKYKTIQCRNNTAPFKYYVSCDRNRKTWNMQEKCNSWVKMTCDMMYTWLVEIILLHKKSNFNTEQALMWTLVTFNTPVRY